MKINNGRYSTRDCLIHLRRSRREKKKRWRKRDRINEISIKQKHLNSLTVTVCVCTRPWGGLCVQREITDSWLFNRFSDWHTWEENDCCLLYRVKWDDESIVRWQPQQKEEIGNGATGFSFKKQARETTFVLLKCWHGTLPINSHVDGLV